MSSSAQNRKDLFSVKPLLAGLLLLLLGAGALGYYFVPYSVPASVEQFSQPAEPEKKDEPAKQPETTGETKHPETTAATKSPNTAYTSKAARPGNAYKPKFKRPSYKNPENTETETAGTETGPPEIELTSPEKGKTLVSSDPIGIEAKVSKGKAVKVDFFYSRITDNGISIYNTLTGVQIPNSPLVKIGSADKEPYRMQNARLDEGVYSIYGIVTDRHGIRQISAPRTVFVSDAPETNTDKKGWYPPLLVSSSASCRNAIVLSWSPQMIRKKGRGNYLVQGEKAHFRSELNIADKNLRYKWRVTDGKITGGQGTDSITVDTTGTGGQTLIATVDMENDKGCRTSASGEARIVQSPDSAYDPSFFEKDPGKEEENIQPEHRYSGCLLTRGKFSFLTTMVDPGPIDLTGISQDLREKWPGELVICPQNKNRLLDENGRLRYKLGRGLGGIYGGGLIYSPSFTNGGTIGYEGEDIIWDLTDVMDTPGDYSIFTEVDDQCGGRSLAAKTVHVTNYCRSCIYALSISNYESLEQDSPATIDQRIDLTGAPDPSGKGLHFNWTTKGRMLAGQGTNTVTTGGWTSNEAAETELYTKVEISGLSDASGVLTFTANLSNFDEIYTGSILRFRDVDPTLPVEEKTRQGIAELKVALKNQLKYDWTVSGPAGRVIASGRKTGAAEIDLTGLKIPKEVELSVKISGWNILFFDSGGLDEAEGGPLPQKDLKCNWRVSTGRILWGQGTNFLIVGDLDLPLGTPVTAEVECDGPDESCPYVATVFSAVGRVYGGGGDGPRPTRPSNYQSSGHKIYTPGDSTAYVPDTKHGSHKSTPGEDPGDTPQQDDTATHDILPPSDKTSKKAAEREFVKIAWPTEPVYVNQAFNVIATYNRTTEAVQIKDNAGEVVSELKSTELNRLIKEKWGPGIEVVAQIRLQSAALYQSETASCSPDCQSDYFSLASDEQKWTFNVTAHNPGEHKFNLEMRIKPKVEDPNRPPEKVWSKEDLKLTVKAEMPTRLQIFASSGVLGVFGLFFLVRGVNFKLMIAGGDIVGGDKVGGDKVGGDKVGGDKVGGDKIGGNKIDPGGGP